MVLNDSKGFTLIELLVILSIVGLILSGTIISFINIQRKGLVSQSAQKIVQDLRMAQSKALNHQKPTNCNLLESYIFKIISFQNPPKYQIIAKCQNREEIIQDTELPPSILLQGLSSVEFKVLRQLPQCNPPDNCQLTVKGYNIYTKTIQVTGESIE